MSGDSMKIRAAVLRERDAPFTIEEVELRGPGHGEILVRIVGAGFCHTDVLPRRNGYRSALPLVMGHEGAGVVEALGPGVTDVEVGAHVVLSFDHCTHCADCLAGHPAYCRDFWQRNLVGRTGSDPLRAVDAAGEPIGAQWFGQSSFATHVVTASSNAVPVPQDCPLELLGALGCGALTGAGAVFNVLPVEPGSTFAVFGAGAVGLSAVMAAVAVGATRIIVVDRHRSRLDLALEMGATDVIQPDPEADIRREIRQKIRSLTGPGVHAALDTTGVPALITGAIESLRPRGVLGLVTAPTDDLVLPGDILATGRTVAGILEGDAVPRVDIPRLIDLWRAGRFPIERMMTPYPLSDINAAEADAASGKTIKPVLIPGEAA
jgi:aryl-alcohol dehydrogenase